MYPFSTASSEAHQHHYDAMASCVDADFAMLTMNLPSVLMVLSELRSASSGRRKASVYVPSFLERI